MIYGASVMCEVTRWCNLQCSHCLRGNRQRKKMTKETIRNVSIVFRDIDVLSLGGGEPMLACDVINELADRCQYGNFFMATNGVWVKKINDYYFREYKELLVIKKLMRMANDGSFSVGGIKISNDIFHDNKNYQRQCVSGINEYTGKSVAYVEEYGATENELILTGKAYTEMQRGDKQEFSCEKACSVWSDASYDEAGDYFSSVQVYVSWNGDVFACHNMSYSDMRKKKLWLGNVNTNPQEIKENMIKAIERWSEE